MCWAANCSHHRTARTRPPGALWLSLPKWKRAYWGWRHAGKGHVGHRAANCCYPPYQAGAIGPHRSFTFLGIRARTPFPYFQTIYYLCLPQTYHCHHLPQKCLDIFFPSHPFPYNFDTQMHYMFSHSFEALWRAINSGLRMFAFQNRFLPYPVRRDQPHWDAHTSCELLHAEPVLDRKRNPLTYREVGTSHHWIEMTRCFMPGTSTQLWQ